MLWNALLALLVMYTAYCTLMAVDIMPLLWSNLGFHSHTMAMHPYKTLRQTCDRPCQIRQQIFPSNAGTCYAVQACGNHASHEQTLLEKLANTCVAQQQDPNVAGRLSWCCQIASGDELCILQCCAVMSV